MIIIKLFFISILFFSQVHSFCIYNKLTDGSSFHVTQKVGSGATLGKNFYKKMEPGDKRCCNYKVKDCSSDQKNDSTVIFAVRLYLINGKSPDIDLYGKCTSGGALVVRGDSEDYYYQCVDANNYTTLGRLAYSQDELLNKY